MKKTIKIFLLLIFTAAVLDGKLAAQTKAGDENASPYDVMNLKFALDADPSPEAVGFDDPKSYWKFSYELRFLENIETALEKFGYQRSRQISGETPAERTKRIGENNKQFAKAWKKFGIRAAKGKVSEKEIFSQETRDMTIPVSLSPEIKNALAQSDVKNSMPNFYISIKGKLYSKTKSGLKFKQKIQNSYVCPAKMIVNGKPEWMMNTCGVYTNIVRQNDKITIGATSRL